MYLLNKITSGLSTNKNTPISRDEAQARFVDLREKIKIGFFKSESELQAYFQAHPELVGLRFNDPTVGELPIGGWKINHNCSGVTVETKIIAGTFVFVLRGKDKISQIEKTMVSVSRLTAKYLENLGVVSITREYTPDFEKNYKIHIALNELAEHIKKGDFKSELELQTYFQSHPELVGLRFSDFANSLSISGWKIDHHCSGVTVETKIIAGTFVFVLRGKDKRYQTEKIMVSVPCLAVRYLGNLGAISIAADTDELINLAIVELLGKEKTELKEVPGMA
jgi:hypothetical protein